MNDTDAPRWLVVWKYVAITAIAVSLSVSGAIIGLADRVPSADSTYATRFRSQGTFYVSPVVGVIHSASLPAALSLFASYVLATYLVERRRAAPGSRERVSLSTIARSPAKALIAYLLGVCLCLGVSLFALGNRGSMALVLVWTIVFVAVLLVARRSHKPSGPSS